SPSMPWRGRPEPAADGARRWQRGWGGGFGWGRTPAGSLIGCPLPDGFAHAVQESLFFRLQLLAGLRFSPNLIGVIDVRRILAERLESSDKGRTQQRGNPQAFPPPSSGL